MKKKFFVVLLEFCFFIGFGQLTPAQVSSYCWPEEPEVLRKLDQWQDQKFGMLIHWGLYSVPGIVESWSICSEEEDWIPRDSACSYEAYKKWYWNLINDFNPTCFNPEQWAETAKEAGMRYVIFTTKHHDGFNMFNTAYSEFSIAKGPFGNNPRSDVAKYVFDAFRQKNFMIGAYFSKPDWHSEYYWWPRYATPRRSENYNIEKNPWRWKQFKTFTYNQLSELMHNYGPLDILWLDGGWVNVPGRKSRLDMPRIAEMARRAQPGILIVDRMIQGKYENYQTPEQQIPDTLLPHPWETCMTLSDNWGYVPEAKYKSPELIVSRLIEIVAKGGCLALGVGPTPEGFLPEEAVECLHTIGEWLNRNGKAIYSTRPASPYQNNGIWFTRSKDRKTYYALYAKPGEQKFPAYIEWENHVPRSGSKIICLQNGKKVKWEKRGQRVRIRLPKDLNTPIHALAFAFLPENPAITE